MTGESEGATDLLGKLCKSAQLECEEEEEEEANEI